MKNEMHHIQASILRVLLFTPQARFTDLNTEKISTDHFNFHVQRLLELGLIEKDNNDHYTLTNTGKEFANRFDADGRNMIIERQAKIGVLIGCIRGTGKEKEFLIQQRLKQPYYGYHGFVTGKVKWGEVVVETARRELAEETGLSADLQLVGVEHKTDYSESGELLEDKYFFVFRGTNPQGTFVEQFEGGRNMWIRESALKQLPEVFPDVLDIITILNSKHVVFKEARFIVSKY